jgi:hypothetical protein
MPKIQALLHQLEQCRTTHEQVLAQSLMATSGHKTIISPTARWNHQVRREQGILNTPEEDRLQEAGPKHLETIGMSFVALPSCLRKKKRKDWLPVSASYVGRQDTLVVTAPPSER